MSAPKILDMLKLYHDGIRELNDEVCAYFNETDIDANSSYLVTQRLCEAAFWLHQLYYSMEAELKESQPKFRLVKVEPIEDRDK